VDPGFDPESVLTFDLVLPQDYLAERKLAVAEEIAARLGAWPGITASGFSDGPPLSNRTARPYGAYAPPPREGDDSGVEIDQRLVSTDYLQALGARLVAGRWFEEGDSSREPGPIMVNRAYARYYFDGVDPVGAVLPTRSGPAVVVGVIDDIRFLGLDSTPSLVGFAHPRHALTLNNRQLAERGRERGADGNRLFLTGFTGGLAYTVRVAGNPLSVVPDIRHIVSAVDPAAAIDDVMPLEQVIAGTVAEPRFYAVLVGVFGALAAVVAVVGVYGVLAYVVSQRSREFGIRMALGAERRDVLGLVVWRGAVMILIGIPAGIAGAALLTRSLESLLYGLTPMDPWTYAAAGIAFAGVALAASYVPARRATRVDPLAAIRYE
jgi:predicted permease